MDEFGWRPATLVSKFRAVLLWTAVVSVVATAASSAPVRIVKAAPEQDAAIDLWTFERDLATATLSIWTQSYRYVYWRGTAAIIHIPLTDAPNGFPGDTGRAYLILYLLDSEIPGNVNVRHIDAEVFDYIHAPELDYPRTQVASIGRYAPGPVWVDVTNVVAADIAAGRKYAAFSLQAAANNRTTTFAAAEDSDGRGPYLVFKLGPAEPPPAPDVSDEGAVTSSLTELSASWSSVPDAEEYEYAIGNSPVDPGTGYVLDWRSAGTKTSATAGQLSLVAGQTYYWYVKARSGSFDWGAAGASDGVRVEFAMPATWRSEVQPWMDAAYLSSRGSDNRGGTWDYACIVPGGAILTADGGCASGTTMNGQETGCILIHCPIGAAGTSPLKWRGGAMLNVYRLRGEATDDDLECSAKRGWLKLRHLETTVGDRPESLEATAPHTDVADFAGPEGWVSYDVTELIRSDAAAGRAFSAYRIDDGNDLSIGQVAAAEDAAGRGASIVFTRAPVDSTPPSIPVVVDDGAETASGAALHATWSASDPESGVDGFMYAIGTSPSDSGSGYVAPWTSAGIDTEVTRTGLALMPGETYYFYVKAVNAAGQTSPAGTSDGITVTEARGSFTNLGLPPFGVSSSRCWGDFDSDGDLDVCGSGSPRIYANDGRGGFTGLPSGITRGSYGVWGDVDNDGDLDVVATDDSGGYLYTNDGMAFANTGTTLDTGTAWWADWGDFDNDGRLDLALGNSVYRSDPLLGLTRILEISSLEYAGVLSWLDFDNDGDLDIASWQGIRRNDNGFNSGYFSVSYSDELSEYADFDSDGDMDRVYIWGSWGSTHRLELDRNDSGTLRYVEVPPVDEVREASFGDSDGDGDLDLAINVYDYYTQTLHLRILANDAGTFRDLGTRVAGLSGYGIVWCDYDSDGDMDIAWRGGMLRNNSARRNTLPSAPAVVGASIVQDFITFGWNAATDAETPRAGLTYNLRVGTTPGGCDVLSPMSDPVSGFRRILRRGNCENKLSRTLRGLTGSKYYWSVQAVDSNLAGGPWAPEQVFIYEGPDATPPTRPVVHAQQAAANTGMTASVSATDAASGVAYYEYAIVTCYDGTAQQWTPAGPGPEISVSTAGLSPGRFILLVRAVDNAGNVSLAGRDSFWLGELLFSEDFEGGFDLVDWATNSGVCPLDSSGIGKARVPHDWAYATDDRYYGGGFGEVEAPGGHGAAALIWSHLTEVTLATPVIHMRPGVHLFRFRAKATGLAQEAPSTDWDSYFRWQLLSAGRELPQDGWEMFAWSSWEQPIPQRQAFDWREIIVPAYVPEEGDYRLGLACSGDWQPGLAVQVDDVQVLRIGSQVEIIPQGTQVKLAWNAPAGTSTTADLLDIRTVKTFNGWSSGERHEITITRDAAYGAWLQQDVPYAFRVYSTGGPDCPLAFDAYLPMVRIPRTGASISKTWNSVRALYGQSGYTDLTPHSGDTMAAITRGAGTSASRIRRANGAIWQRFTTTPGAGYVFSAWVFTDVEGRSQDNSRATLAVDPSGGINPYRTFEYSVTASTSGAWRRIWLPFVAQGNSTTVFVIAEQSYSADLNITAIDDIDVELDGPAAPVVTDDGAFSVDRTSVHARWEPGEPGQTPTQYRYRLGNAGTLAESTETTRWNYTTSKEAYVTPTWAMDQVYIYVMAFIEGVGWSRTGVSDGISFVDRVVSGTGAAKALTPGWLDVGISGLVATAGPAEIPQRAWLETPDRSGGIQVCTGLDIREGDVVQIAGNPKIESGESVVRTTFLTVTGHQQPLRPLTVRLSALASAPFAYDQPAGTGQPGTTDPPGQALSTVGLLISTCGRVIAEEPDYILINDGSIAGSPGVRVSRMNLPEGIAPGDLLLVTGLSSIRMDGSAIQPLIRVRRPSDVVVVTGTTP